MSTVPETLHAFGAHTLVVRAVSALMATLSPAAALVPYAIVDDALAQGAPEAVRLAARAAALDGVSERILALGAAVDGADRALARRAPTTREAAMEAQAQDAALKLLAIAAVAKSVGGDRPLAALPTGPALLATWAAVDVALPLGGVDLSRLLAERQPAAASTLAAMVGEAALEGVPAMLTALTPRLQAEIDQAVARVDAVARSLAPYVPGLIQGDDGGGALPVDAAEAIAVQSDRLPIYKWLAARIATEHAAVRAGGR